jgi:hypothetical protein
MKTKREYLMKIIYYLISHSKFPMLKYVGSTKNLYNRKKARKYDILNQNSKSHHLKINEFIRKNMIDFNELHWEILDEIDCIDNDMRFKWEQIFLDQFPNDFNEQKAKNFKYQYKRRYYCECCNVSRRYNDRFKHLQSRKHFINCDKLKLINELYG